MDEGLRGSPTILVVDDEELMLEVTCLMIEDNGGNVLSASDGNQALEVFRANRDTLDLICLDFSMPGLNGYEVAERVLEENPAVKIVLMSGLSITPEVERLRDEGRLMFIAKPFREVDLIEAINAALGNGAAPE